MMLRYLTICATALLSGPVLADLVSVRDDHIVPRYTAFAQAAAGLHETAKNDCSVAAVLPAYRETYDAWIGISHIQFGPIETRGTYLSLTFWPDPKDRVGKAFKRLVAARDAAVDDPEEFAQVSVAAQGFSALELLLTEPQGDTTYACAYTRAIAGYISRTAADLAQDWQGEYADVFVSAGESDNAVFPSLADAQRAVYTSISTGMEFLHDQRLGRPLGTFDRPRPKRAEARRSGRSARHVVLSLEALQDLTNAFVDHPLPEIDVSFTATIERAKNLKDPSFAGVDDPSKRFKIEDLQRHVRDVQVLIAQDVGAALGISAGFNALDGD